MKPVCLVVGAGAGIGGTVGKRFAGEGYHVVLCRRSDAEGLNTLIADIKAEGGEASGCLLNAAEEHTLEDMISATEKGVGPIEVVVFNLGAQIGDRALQDTSHKAFELCWRLATLSLFRVASTVCPLMEKRGKGTLLICNSCRSRQSRPACPCCSNGWTPHAVSVAKR
jgi:NAD(P)-dependent dehydrogenase (short-subunit alcohol dehydrogenase family)